jgi:hypothetical protein
MIPLLFERSWFQRMWVIQEVSLPIPSNILVFCGNLYTRWKHFIRGVLKFGELSSSGIPGCMDVFVYIHGLLGPNRRFDRAAFSGDSERKYHFYGPDKLTIEVLQVGRPLTARWAVVIKNDCGSYY